MEKKIITRSEAIEMMIEADIMSLTADYGNLENILLKGWSGYSYMSAIQIMNTYNDMFGKSNIIKECVDDYLEVYAKKVEENESSDYVDLIMDDHSCVEFDGQQYYIPDSNSGYSNNDNIIYDYLMSDNLTLAKEVPFLQVGVSSLGVC